MNLLLVAPILIPLVAAVLSMLLRTSQRAQQSIAVIGGMGMLTSAISLLDAAADGSIQVLRLGDWPAPFGIVLVVDLFSALMLLLTAVIGLAVIVYSLAAIDLPRRRFGYFPLVHVLLMGVSGAFLTGDLFNLFVWFEVMLIASFVLLVLGGEQKQLQGAVKYVTLNLLASAMFLIGTGLLYGKTGTLNLASLAMLSGTDAENAALNVSAVLFLAAFGIKAAVFPFFFWLPDSYHVPPVPVTALFSGLLTKVGIYALMRTFSMVFVHDTDFTRPLFVVLAAMTMITGVIGAVAQGEMRRLLSFHIVSQIGYALIGLAVFTPLALSGAIYFTLHVAIAKTALFLVAGYVLAVRGDTTLKNIGGLLRSAPLLTALFLLAAISLAGLPPFSGFFAKFALVKAGLDAGEFLLAAVALAVGVLTLFSMMKIWNEVFWKDDPNAPTGDASEASASPAAAARITPLTSSARLLYILPLACLVLLTVIMGIAAQGVFEWTDAAARQLLEPEQYIRAVLGGPQ